MKKNLLNFALPIAIGAIGGAIMLTTAGSTASARRAVQIENLQASPTVQRLYDEANQDTKRFRDNAMSAEARDVKIATRVKTIRELYRTGNLSQGPDYLLSAKILSESERSKDVLLAHDLAVLAAAQSTPGALSIATETEDKFLKLNGWEPRYSKTSVESDPTDIASWHRNLVVFDKAKFQSTSTPKTSVQ